MQYTHASVRALVEGELPEKPVHVYRPHAVEKAVRCFRENFNGRICYAVKTNPDPVVLRQLYGLGVTSFDVASLSEIKTVRETLPEAAMYFMHTVKSRRAIREAYFDFGLRDFSLDSTQELNKILEETGDAQDLNLFVRLAIPNTYAEMNLADKFGVGLDEAEELLRLTRARAMRLGVCFHVGSQCMHPDAYRIAMRKAHQAITGAGVKVDMLDIGGGFPSIYPGMTPPPMSAYFAAIDEEFAAMFAGRGIELICEPGRALVAESGAVVVKVELRKGQNLYINDGTYGSLFDAGTPKWLFPVRLLRTPPIASANDLPFSFFGPTCDTLDFMKGPFFLPEDIREGDYIEIGQLGAYSRSLVTSFNGFSPEDGLMVVPDEPLMSLYGEPYQVPEVMEPLAA